MAKSKPEEPPVKDMDNPKPSETVSSWNWKKIFYLLLIHVGTVFFYFYVVLYLTPQIFCPCGVALNVIPSTWIAYNVLGNLWACCRKSSTVDTLPPELRTPAKGEEHLWRYCDQCQKLMPPRSWHCKLCKCCILKRDHHCDFTGNCIGHNNQRYFIWLLFYMSLGSAIMLIYNLVFAWKHDIAFYDLGKIHMMVFLDFAEPNLGFKLTISLIIFLNLLVLLLPIPMLAIEVSMVWKNTVMFDKSNRKYDLGVRKNFNQVLGQLQFWTCLSPAIKSPLPHDVNQWQSKGSD